MHRKFLVNGDVKQPTNEVSIRLNRNVRRSARLTEIAAESLRELTRDKVANIRIEIGSRRLVADVPTGYVFQNCDCKVFADSYYRLFNSKRSKGEAQKNGDSDSEQY